MTDKNLPVTPELYAYLRSISLREPEILGELRAETASHPSARMQILPEQGQLIALLVKLIGATQTLEVGVFTGYSSLAVALALPEQGRIVACDLDADSTATAQKYWQKAGVSHKIELHLRPALETLELLLNRGQGEQFDFAFIDADKQNYDRYYEQTLKLLRPGGLMILDNVLWGGKVADLTIQDPRTQAIRTLNQKLHQDDRIDLSVLAIADGLTLIRKRSNS